MFHVMFFVGGVAAVFLGALASIALGCTMIFHILLETLLPNTVVTMLLVALGASITMGIGCVWYLAHCRRRPCHDGEKTGDIGSHMKQVALRSHVMRDSQPRYQAEPISSLEIPRHLCPHVVDKQVHDAPRPLSSLEILQPPSNYDSGRIQRQSHRSSLSGGCCFSEHQNHRPHPRNPLYRENNCDTKVDNNSMEQEQAIADGATSRKDDNRQSRRRFWIKGLFLLILAMLAILVNIPQHLNETQGESDYIGLLFREKQGVDFMTARAEARESTNFWCEGGGPNVEKGTDDWSSAEQRFQARQNTNHWTNPEFSFKSFASEDRFKGRMKTNYWKSSQT